MGKLSSEQISGLVSKGTSLLSGLSGLVNIYKDQADIADTSMQNSQIDAIEQLGFIDYNTFDQLNSAYGTINSIQPDLNYNSIRGGSDGERAGNVLSATANGALTGLSVGGPYGAIAGAVVGLGSSIGGWLVGNAKAEQEQKRLRNEYVYSMQNSKRGIDSSAENILTTQHRNNVINSTAMGGTVKRQQSLSEFAESVLNKSRSRSYNPNSMVVREMCDGGIRIRIKR